MRSFLVLLAIALLACFVAATQNEISRRLREAHMETTGSSSGESRKGEQNPETLERTGENLLLTENTGVEITTDTKLVMSVGAKIEEETEESLRKKKRKEQDPFGLGAIFKRYKKEGDNSLDKLIMPTCYDADRLTKVLQLQGSKSYNQALVLSRKFTDKHPFEHQWGTHYSPIHFKLRTPFTEGATFAMKELDLYDPADCHRLDESEYSGTADGITEDSLEFRTGCAAFKTVSLDFAKIIGHDDIGWSDVQKFAYYATQTPSDRDWKEFFTEYASRSVLKPLWEKKVKEDKCIELIGSKLELGGKPCMTVVAQIRRAAKGDEDPEKAKEKRESIEKAVLALKVKDATTLLEIINEIPDLEEFVKSIEEKPISAFEFKHVGITMPTKDGERIQRIAKFLAPKRMLRALVCAPTTYGGVGMISNGLSDHSMSWYGLSSHPITIPYRVGISSTCARLSTHLLLQFSRYRYMHDKLEAGIELLRASTGRGSYKDVCVFAKAGQCRTYSDCFLRATALICAQNAACCPSTTVHEKCKQKNSDDNLGISCGVYSSTGILYNDPFATCSDCKDGYEGPESDGYWDRKKQSRKEYNDKATTPVSSAL